MNTSGPSTGAVQAEAAGANTNQTHNEPRAAGELESIRAFGRRVGRSHPTIIQAIEEGRIRSVKRDQVTGKVLGIYWRQAVAEYSNNTDPTQAERTGATPLNTSAESSTPDQAAMPPGAGGAGSDDTVTIYKGSSVGKSEHLPLTGQLASASSQEGAGPPGGDLFQPAKQQKEDPHGYLEHRARTEQFKAKQAELEYLKDLGLLVSAAEVREAQFRRDRTLRDKLLNVPDRIATIVAAERDPARVHQQITDEIKRILNELSINAAAEAAGGAAERVAT